MQIYIGHKLRGWKHVERTPPEVVAGFSDPFLVTRSISGLDDKWVRRKVALDLRGMTSANALGRFSIVYWGPSPRDRPGSHKKDLGANSKVVGESVVIRPKIAVPKGYVLW